MPFEPGLEKESRLRVPLIVDWQRAPVTRNHPKAYAHHEEKRRGQNQETIDGPHLWKRSQALVHATLYVLPMSEAMLLALLDRACAIFFPNVPPMSKSMFGSRPKTVDGPPEEWSNELAPFGDRTLKVVWDISNKCNLRCRMCH